MIFVRILHIPDRLDRFNGAFMARLAGVMEHLVPYFILISGRRGRTWFATHFYYALSEVNYTQTDLYYLAVIAASRRQVSNWQSPSAANACE